MAPRNLKLVAGVGAGAFVLAFAVTYATRPQPGFITGLHPIDGERAVFTMRHNRADGPAQAWIGVTGPKGVVWSRELPDLTYSIYMRHGLAVDGDLVAVQVSDEKSYAQLLTFDATSGEPRWSGERLTFAPSEFDAMLFAVPGAAPFADGGQVFFPVHDRETASFVMHAADDGAVSWTLPLSTRAVHRMARTAEHLVYRSELGWTVLRRADGSKVLELDGYGAACVEDGRLSSWADDQLRIVDLSKPEPSTIAHPLPTPGVTQTCGTHDGLLVFTVGGAVTQEQRHFEVVGVDPVRAEVVWRIDLGDWEPSTIARERDNDGPDADTLGGAISSFAPVLLERHGSDDVKLAVLDLKSHAIAWESRPRPELLHYQVLRGSGDQHFLDGRADLAAIDGTTGELTAAIQIEHNPVRSFYAVDGRLWVSSMEYGDLDALRWLTLDGRTLVPVAGGTDEYRPVDNRSAFRSWLR